MQCISKEVEVCLQLHPWPAGGAALTLCSIIVWDLFQFFYFDVAKVFLHGLWPDGSFPVGPSV